MFTRIGLPTGLSRGFAIWLALLPVGAAVKGQVDTNHVIISGKVVDPQQNPLEGVELHAIGDTVRVLTSGAGTFRLSVFKKAEMLIQARRLGYNAVLLRMTDDWNGIVMMTPGAFALPEIEVTSRYAKPAKYANTSKYDDFFRRRRLGIGDFITPEDIARRSALLTAEILEGRTGMKISVQPGRGVSVDFTRCHEYPPKINVYVNGQKLFSSILASSTGPSGGMMGGAVHRDPEVAGAVGEMLSRVNPSAIEFIEVFRGPAELPAEFNDGNCGAIAIWTH